ncbi:MAG: hypothetical protein A3J65_04465 [Candidatus Buchananbacteria bacterium RIFCSPHIGHO2_02_FULL_45_11b]|uniref:Uncharacterized protein n=1 Tax=Candidatus Buchananbacteria bacterium RIFCSPHIGHO2_02_FULL_45_11b TaxID=1797541 RepID=A0A1G1YD17_9BACT|nr:MAG: hypothetical protein A3J65_04465 [Candidatus Buchananbacteria bacterium RIFCSPHIGHO2_02_FULL_45_11b]
MKILLVNPPFEAFLKNPQAYFPLGLTYLAAALKQFGDEVIVYDCDYDFGEIEHAPDDIETINHYEDYYRGVYDYNHPIWQKVKKNISEIKPAVVGLTSYSTKLPATIHLTNWLAEQNIPVYIGGPHETTWGTGAGISIKGEGELKFARILHPDLNIEFDPLKLIPDRKSLYRVNDYRPNDLGLVMGERGCPFNCYFCQTKAIWGEKIRKRPIDHIIEEIKLINHDFGAKQFYLCDDTFTYDLNRVKEFIEKIPEDFEWACLTRPSTISRELLSLLKKSKCIRVKLGIETGSPKMLKLIGKTETVEIYRKAAKLLAEFNIDWTAYLMIALPQETEEDWQLTQKLIEELKPRWASGSIYTPFPKTILSENFKVDFSHHDWPRYSHQSPYAWSGLSKEKIIERIQWLKDYNKNHGGDNPYRQQK